MVYIALHRMADKHSVVRASIRAIAADKEMAKSTVKIAIDRLALVGLLVVHGRGKVNDAIEYHLPRLLNHPARTSAEIETPEVSRVPKISTLVYRKSVHETENGVPKISTRNDDPCTENQYTGVLKISTRSYIIEKDLESKTLKSFDHSANEQQNLKEVVDTKVDVPQKSKNRRPRDDIDSSLLGDFETVWKLFVRKVGKANALKAYRTHCKSFEHREQLRLAVEVMRPAWLAKEENGDREYICHPSTFINRLDWRDELVQLRIEAQNALEARQKACSGANGVQENWSAERIENLWRESDGCN